MTISPIGKTQAENLGFDIVGLLNSIQLECEECIAQLNNPIASIPTPAGTEAANITTLQGFIA